MFSMNINVRLESDADRKEWNSNLLKNKASTTYQNSNWLSVYQQTYDSQPLYLYVEDNKGNILAQLAALIHDSYFWVDANPISKKIGTRFHLRKSIHWNYGPIIFNEENHDDIIKAILEKLDQFAIKNKITSINGIFPPLFSQPSEQNLRQNGYKIIPWATYNVLVNQSITKLQESYDKKTRYDLRKAESHNFEFKIVNKQEDLWLFRKMKNLSRSVLGKRSSDEKINDVYFEHLWQNLYKKDLEKMFLVNKDGKTIAGMRVLTFNKNMIQFSVVNDPNTKILGGPYLTWNVIKWANKNNFLNFDLGGINPNPSSLKEKQIDFYKSKWGDQLLPYIRCLKVFSNQQMKLSALLKNPKSISKKIKK